MEYKNEELGCSFVLPDRMTVRQQLGFWDRYTALGKDASSKERNWEAGAPLVEDWVCTDLPDPTVSLDDLYTARQAQIVNWAGNRFISHVALLDAVPKA